LSKTIGIVFILPSVLLSLFTALSWLGCCGFSYLQGCFQIFVWATSGQNLL